MYATPPRMFSSIRKRFVTPNVNAVGGVSCMMPSAPFVEMTFGCQPIQRRSLPLRIPRGLRMRARSDRPRLASSGRREDLCAPAWDRQSNKTRVSCPHGRLPQGPRPGVLMRGISHSTRARRTHPEALAAFGLPSSLRGMAGENPACPHEFVDAHDCRTCSSSRISAIDGGFSIL